MKLRIFSTVFLVFAPLFADKNHTSQITMFTRPLSRKLAIINSIWDEVITNKKGDNCFAAQLIPIYQRSHDDCCISSYFLVNNKPVISVVGDNASTADDPYLVVDRDVRAEWLGLSDTFVGDFTVNPKQRQAGAIFEINQDLYPLIPIDFFRTWWLDVAIPLFKVKNQLSTKNSSPEVVEALQSPRIRFAKFANGENCKIGVGEISVNLGGTFVCRDGFLLTYYGGFGIPGERAPRPDFIFPASLGNQDHWTIIAGATIKAPLLEWEDGMTMRLFIDLENRYFLSTHQMRSFDLRYKQWSRYLPVREQGVLQTIPLVNILTLCVKVKPHSYAEFSTGLEFSNECWHLQIGYDLWTHASEQIKYNPYCDKTPPYFTRFGIAGSTADTSASNSTIALQAEDDPEFVTIKISDIDLRSGASRGTVVQGGHVALYTYLANSFVGIGGFFESPNNNAALQNWGVWGKIGTEF